MSINHRIELILVADHKIINVALNTKEGIDRTENRRSRGIGNLGRTGKLGRNIFRAVDRKGCYVGSLVYVSRRLAGDLDLNPIVGRDGNTEGIYVKTAGKSNALALVIEVDRAFVTGKEDRVLFLLAVKINAEACGIGITNALERHLERGCAVQSKNFAALNGCNRAVLDNCMVAVCRILHSAVNCFFKIVGSNDRTVALNTVTGICIRRIVIDFMECCLEFLAACKTVFVAVPALFADCCEITQIQFTQVIVIAKTLVVPVCKECTED